MSVRMECIGCGTQFELRNSLKCPACGSYEIYEVLGQRPKKARKENGENREFERQKSMGRRV